MPACVHFSLSSTGPALEQQSKAPFIKNATCAGVIYGNQSVAVAVVALPVAGPSRVFQRRGGTSFAPMRIRASAGTCDMTPKKMASSAGDPSPELHDWNPGEVTSSTLSLRYPVRIPPGTGAVPATSAGRIPNRAGCRQADAGSRPRRRTIAGRRLLPSS